MIVNIHKDVEKMGRKPEGKAEKSFKNFGKKLDSYIEDLKIYKEKFSEEYSDQIDELKRNRDTLEKEFQDFKESDRWSKVEEKLENAANEVRDAFKQAFKKKPNEGESRKN